MTVCLLGSRWCEPEMTVRNVVMQLFDSRHCMVACDPAAGMYLTVAAIFRGLVSVKVRALLRHACAARSLAANHFLRRYLTICTLSG